MSQTEGDYTAYPCPNCGSTTYQEGWVDDDRQGRVRWIAGQLRRSAFGNAKGRVRNAKLSVIAYRCTHCSRLELYALDR
ncbi:hypothetical protein [Nocardioides sp. GXZ039]|uniref:hypothetical protein n=1 Tax=Nocardioides sp. GXZ039 TaxID=3136018 RepID=UPI0030F4085D